MDKDGHTHDLSVSHRQLCGWNSTPHSETRKTLVSWNPVIFPGWCSPLTCFWTPNTYIQTFPHSLYCQNLAVNLAELHKCWVSQWLNVNYAKARKQPSSKKELAFKVIFKIKNSNFEIITCFHEVVTNNTENPWTLYPVSSVTTPGQTIIKYPNQDIDTDTKDRTLPLLQGALMLPFHSHTRLPPPARPTPMEPVNLFSTSIAVEF